MILRILVAALAVSLAHTASAHEFWIESDRYAVAPGAVLRLSLHCGERFLAGPIRRDETMMGRFSAFSAVGEYPVVGRSGGVSSLVRLDVPNDYIVAFQSRPHRHEMEPARFETYLRDEGLNFILPQRAALGESNLPGREVFVRCAKLLVSAGGISARYHTAPIGMPLEILPQAELAPCDSGSRLPLQIWFDSQPLAGATVVAVSKSEPSALQRSATDDDGLVAFDLTHADVWMITTIHMVRAGEGAGYEWASYWASLTFEIPPTGPVASGERREGAGLAATLSSGR